MDYGLLCIVSSCLLELGLAKLSWPIGLKKIGISVLTQTMNHLCSYTFVVNEVSPAEFSLVRLPLCGPALGFWPFAKADRIFLVVSGVRSSYSQ
jgi:hypothetical protein